MSRMSAPNPTSAHRGTITLGNLLDAVGLRASDVHVLRHSYTKEELATPQSVTADGLLAYTRRQGIGNKLGKDPAPIWLVFGADGARRSRLIAVYENFGEVAAERTAERRFFDLRTSDYLAELIGRLVIEWSRDPINWAKPGATAQSLPIVEISEPAPVPFPGLNRLLIDYSELKSMVIDPRYRDWQSALGAVAGIYLIADQSTGRLYVGKADGEERILGRWRSYAYDGHGGNVELKRLLAEDPDRCRDFVYSILRVFSPAATSGEIDSAEAHYKEALLTRQHGLNRN